jgi:putative proteasome-type protease
VVPAQAGLSMADEYQRLQTAEEQARMQRQAALSRR